MKTYSIIIHPYTLIISFCLILISGQHWGGFYLLYLLLALPHGGAHALFGLVGILFLLFHEKRFKQKEVTVLGTLVHMAGVMLLLLSLFVFFRNDTGNYNEATFYQPVPLVSLSLFGMLALLHITGALFHFFRTPERRGLTVK